MPDTLFLLVLQEEFHKVGISAPILQGKEKGSVRLNNLPKIIHWYKW